VERIATHEGVLTGRKTLMVTTDVESVFDSRVAENVSLPYLWADWPGGRTRIAAIKTSGSKTARNLHIAK